ncbi:hypothetical protein CPHO_10920 [Corynebacterium phocae]|uniref:SCP domain-containing protein n=1 Tax=Corynebacterium phocae TaxID=161895 RepID=A0A1L7D598_9CORY|nr:CAP domain-containing protein [Corynebacterium phocae]APT93319.1 hypothetical protein CPHO_10920 [Corynebacterium phocae]KAA8721650.1 CAP domain-containing protein [Corynebacterium phocae]
MRKHTLNGLVSLLVAAALGAHGLTAGAAPALAQESPFALSSGIPAALSSGIGPKPVGPAPGPDYVLVDGVWITNFDARFFEIMNNYRRANGRQPVRVSQELTDQARRWSWHMGRTGHFVHSHDKTFENIAMRPAGLPLTPEDFFVQWRNSPGHNANMLSHEVTRAGFSISDPSQPRVYATLQLLW